MLCCVLSPTVAALNQHLANIGFLPRVDATPSDEPIPPMAQDAPPIPPRTLPHLCEPATGPVKELVASTLRSYGNNTMRERGVDIAILGVDIAILGVDIGILGVDMPILGVDIAVLGAVVPSGCVAARAVETAEVAGARGCVAAETGKVAGLAEAGGCVAAGTTKVTRLAVGSGSSAAGRQKSRGWP